MRRHAAAKSRLAAPSAQCPKGASEPGRADEPPGQAALLSAKAASLWKPIAALDAMESESRKVNRFAGSNHCLAAPNADFALRVDDEFATAGRRRMTGSGAVSSAPTVLCGTERPGAHLYLRQ
jgi:hypothetical protein